MYEFRTADYALAGWGGFSSRLHAMNVHTNRRVVIDEGPDGVWKTGPFCVRCGESIGKHDLKPGIPGTERPEIVVCRGGMPEAHHANIVELVKNALAVPLLPQQHQLTPALATAGRILRQLGASGAISYADWKGEHGLRILANGTFKEVWPHNGEDFKLVELQDYVKGDIEILDLGLVIGPSTRPINGYVMVIDEEGKYNNKRLNDVATPLWNNEDDWIAGDVIICRTEMVR